MSRNSSCRARTLALLFAWAVVSLASGRASASDANWLPSNAALATQPSALSQTVDGVLVTARGYVAEFGPSASTVIGPFPTTTFGSRQIFGNLTEVPDPAASAGLGLYVVATPGNAVSGVDYGGANVLPEIDSGICQSSPCSYVGDNPDIPGPPRPKMDFVLFTFSRAVDVSSFITNTASDWWAAGWTSVPALSSGLEGALSTASAIHPKDVTLAADLDPFTHRLPTFESVVAMLVAVPPPVSGFGVRPLAFPSGFAVRDVEFAVAVAAVPEPSDGLMLAVGLCVVAALMRRKRLVAVDDIATLA